MRTSDLLSLICVLNFDYIHQYTTGYVTQHFSRYIGHCGSLIRSLRVPVQGRRSNID